MLGPRSAWLACLSALPVFLWIVGLWILNSRFYYCDFCPRETNLAPS